MMITALALSLSLLSGAGSLCGNSSPDPGEQCDDGNGNNGDGCSAICEIETGFLCTVAEPATPDVNLITDGSFEDYNIEGAWDHEHSLFGPFLCGDNCFDNPPASDLDGNITGGVFLALAGGSPFDASTGYAEHIPIILPPAAQTLAFNWMITGTNQICADAGDGLRVLIDGTELWSSLDNGPCQHRIPYTVETVDLPSLGLNDGNLHTLRFEGSASVLPSADQNTSLYLDQIRIMVPPPNPLPPVPSVCTAIVCGDGLQVGGEVCDDGNLTDGDGCSSTCEVEPNFVCDDAQAAAAEGDDIADGSLEQGRDNPDWVSAGTLFDPICSQVFCGAALADTEDGGAFYAWFGGFSQPNEQTLTQDVVISSTATELTFKLLVGICDSVNDNLSIEVDGTNVFDFPCDDSFPAYTPITVPLGAFADGASHTVSFIGSTVALNGGNSNIFVDDISIGTNVAFAGAPGVCFELAEACTTPEQFSAGIPGDWSVINLGALGDGWGTSNDGICASQNWSGGNAQNNTTDGGGIAACADSDATGQIEIDTGGGLPIEMDTYLCSPMLDLDVTDPQLSFLVNYQAADNVLNDNGTQNDNTDDFDDDFLEVVVGTAAPNAQTVLAYESLINVFDHLDTTLATSPEGAMAADLTAFRDNNGNDAYVCFHYRGTYAWFAQIDNPALRATSCTAGLIDSDGDGVGDDVDNCTLLINPTQRDTDADGHGNRCDADFNNDCSVNAQDLGIFRTLFFMPGNQGDLNGDGITSVTDLGLFRTLFFSTPGPSAAGLCTN